MFTSSTSQQLVISLQQQECLNVLEQRLLIDKKPCFYKNNWRGLLAKLMKMSIYNEFYIAEEQRTMISAAKVRKQRKKIKNTFRKIDLFHYFVRTCISRSNTDEW